MQILILQGSPRAKGNTAWMAEEYKKQVQKLQTPCLSIARPRPLLTIGPTSPMRMSFSII